MADAGITVREGEDSDLPEVIELLKSSLGEGAIPRTLEFWRWKHQESPFGRSPFWLATTKDGIVGLRVFMRWRWQAGAGTAEAVRAVDTATHPDYQGKGIFKTLTLHGVEELQRRGIAFVFNTPNGKSRPGYLKMGWSTVGRTSLWVSPRNPAALARVMHQRWRRGQIAATPDADDAARDGGARVLDDARVRRLIDGRGDSGDRFRTPRDAAFVEWRYVRCPACRYEFTASDEGNVLAVHRARRRSGAKEVGISEFLYDRERASVREMSSLLGRVLETARADYAVAAPPATARCAAALALAGFLPAPQLGPIMTVRPMAVPAGLPDPLLRRSWAPTVGDLELF